MRHASARLLIVCSALTLFAGCDKSSPFAPDDDAAFASFSGTSPALSISTVSASQITLTWQDVSTLESGYEVHRSTTGAGGAFALLAVTGPDVTSYDDAGLTAATEYCYKVRAYRKPGRKTSYSAFSSISCATTLPGPAAPTGVDARPASELSWAVRVTWIDNSADENGFRIERASSADGPWSLVNTTSANITSYVDSGLESEQQLCYRVISFYTAGGASPSNVDCTYYPAAPTALTVTAASGAAVDLAWTDNSAYEGGYDVERLEPGSWPFVTVGSVPANTSTFHDATVSANKSYVYRVWVTREGVRTGVSNQVNAVTATEAPSAPSGLNAVPAGSTAISAYWIDASANEAGFRVERSDNGGASWTTVATIPINGTGFYDTDRVSDQQVCYRVIAFNSVGDSPPSSVDCTAPPTAPTNLVATTAPDLAIDLTWSDNSTVEDAYEVQRYVVECGGYYYYYCYEYYVTIATVGPNVTSYRDAGLSPAVQHSYQVVAIKDGGWSNPSNQASAWSNLPPAAPASLTATAVSRTQIDLAWSDHSTDEVNFVVTRCTGTEAACGDANFTGSFWLGADATTFSDTSVQPNTTYTYRVFSYNGHFSQPSNRASATTLP